MDDVAIRAITIGASVLIALITISAVLTYYTAAKDMVRQIGSGTDIAGLYEKSIEEILLKKTITGTELKNLINYFDSIGEVKCEFMHLSFIGDSKIVLLGADKMSLNKRFRKYINNALPNMTYDIETYSIKDGEFEITFKLSETLEKIWFENYEFTKYVMSIN